MRLALAPRFDALVTSLKTTGTNGALNARLDDLLRSHASKL
jgi:hypothetical protein